MEIIKLLTSGRMWWLAVTLHRRCIIIIYSFKIGWGGLNRKSVSRRLSVGGFYFCFRSLWLMCPILEESIFLTKEELAFPGDIVYSCIRFIFCCHGLPGFTLHLLQGVMKIEFIWQSPTCIVWLGQGLSPSVTTVHKVQVEFCSLKNLETFQGQKLC